jgi:DNA-binding response OmpR family regulator
VPLILQPLAKFNLSHASILLIEAAAAEMDLYGQMLSGFGASLVSRCATEEEALAALDANEFDLVLIDAKLGDGDGYDFVRRLRRRSGAKGQVPVLMIAGHTARSRITLARDCGAHFLVRKPLSPAVLLERILWIAHETRPFIECDGYAGPDRRFQMLGPPEGQEGRRREDQFDDLAGPAGPDLDQTQVDQMFKPRRASS